MTLKNKVIISIVSLLTAFGFGRYSANQRPNVQTKETVTANATQQTDKNVETETTITTEKDPNGVVKTVETIDSKDLTKVETENQSVKILQQTVTQPKQSKINLSFVASSDVFKGALAPSYGLYASKEILGPITAGVYGLTNGTVGVTVGLDF
jgi:hypothetical protein